MACEIAENAVMLLHSRRRVCFANSLYLSPSYKAVGFA